MCNRLIVHSGMVTKLLGCWCQEHLIMYVIGSMMPIERKQVSPAGWSHPFTASGTPVW